MDLKTEKYPWLPHFGIDAEEKINKNNNKEPVLVQLETNVYIAEVYNTEILLHLK